MKKLVVLILAVSLTYRLIQSGVGYCSVAAAETTCNTQTNEIKKQKFERINVMVNTCPPLQSANGLTKTQFISWLTAPCRYDRLERPHVVKNGSVSSVPVRIYIRIYISVLQNRESSDMRFKMQGFIRMRYNDSRLQFSKYASNRTESLVGDSSLKGLIWLPHIFMGNEHNSNVLGNIDKDIFVAISPGGTVILSSRIETSLYCWTNLQKFPFEEQFCSAVLESWIYNSSELVLHWEQKQPVAFDPKIHLTKYALNNVWTNETIVTAGLNDLQDGLVPSNYSSISFTIYLTREVGYYTMDYFLPSIMIVAISWVSFWLQADQTPARTTLGCTTLLSFITLSSSQANDFPKISHIKISEIWFLICTCFIFGSLVEFAFVNTIWRRTNSLEVKKVTSKYILKSTLTPNVKRHKMLENVSRDKHLYRPNAGEENLAAIDAPVIITVDEGTTQSLSLDQCITYKENSSWAKMTPHEASLWIDKKARFIFPLAFVIFNAFFWAFVYCL